MLSFLLSEGSVSAPCLRITALGLRDKTKWHSRYSLEFYVSVQRKPTSLYSVVREVPARIH